MRPLYERLREQVQYQVWDQVCGVAPHRVWDSVWVQLRDPVGDQVCGYLNRQVWDQALALVRGSE